jgi:hypothetical protein
MEQHAVVWRFISLKISDFTHSCGFIAFHEVTETYEKKAIADDS